MITRKKLPLLFAACIVFASIGSTALAQSTAVRDKWADSVQILIDASVRTGNAQPLEEARTILDRTMAAFPGDPLLLHYDGYALYRKATLALVNPSTTNSRPMLDKAREQLEKSSKKLLLPETFALQSAVLGRIIALSKNPVTGMTLGKKSGDAMDRAVELGARNPRVWLLRGIGAMFTPSMWGGGLDKAAAHLQKAVSLFESDQPQKPMPAWGKAEAFIWLGQVYANQGKADAARAAFDSAVKLEPDNGWAQALLSGRAKPVAVR